MLWSTIAAFSTALTFSTSYACPACSGARTMAAAGDTARAVATLREAVRESPHDPEALGLLGSYLIHTAPLAGTDFQQRKEGEDFLWRAIDRDADDPRWWFALGVLARRRLLKADARRFFLRAADLVRRGDPTLSIQERARILTGTAQALEEHVLDFQGLVPGATDFPVVTATDRETCPVSFCLNFERPRRFHEILFRYDTQEDLVAEDRAEMRALFGAAVLLDPGLEPAVRGWLGELARSGEWEAYVEVARRHVEATGSEGWPLIFLGAGLWRLGDLAGAEEVFAAGISTVPPLEADFLDDVRELVRRDRARMLTGEGPRELVQAREHLWRILDPVLLTEPNERRLEHYARVALAELWFEEPLAGVRGAATERGVILIRYGEPLWIRQLRIEDGHRQAIEFARNGVVYRDPITGMIVDIDMGPQRPGGGRWLLWTYSKDAPSFVFEKGLGARRVLLAPSSASKEYEEFARDRRPSSFVVPNLLPLHHQVARFKGTEGDVEADVIVGLPVLPDGFGSLDAEAGFFLLPGRAGDRFGRLDSRVELSDVDGRTVTFRVPLNEGRYTYATEVMSEDRSLVATDRDELRAVSFPEVELSVSDLLVARSIEPRLADPRDRRHLAIRPSADLIFATGEAVGILLEIYGLRADPEAGAAHYTVDVSLRSEDGGVLAGIARRASELLGRSEEEGRLRWTGSVNAGAIGDRVVEWFTLTLSEAEPGTYTLEVKIRDGAGDREAVAARRITFDGAR